VIHEKSAGAVVYHESNNMLEYLLLLYEAGHWDFPKGGVEGGESEVDTALREVREETGLNSVQILEGFRKEIEYMYRKQGQLVKKKVVFYLARSDTKDVRLSYEHRAFIWLNYENALRNLTYRTAKATLMEAHKFLTQRRRRLSQT